MQTDFDQYEQEIIALIREKDELLARHTSKFSLLVMIFWVFEYTTLEASQEILRRLGNNQ